MADTDFRKGAPIRTEEDVDFKVQVKHVDYTDPDGVGRQTEVFESRGNSRTDAEYQAIGNTLPSTSGIMAHLRNAVVTAVQLVNRITSVAGDNDKVSLDVAISDSNGNSFTEANPLPTFPAEDPSEEIIDFDDTIVISNGGTSNHEISVADGKTFLITDIFADAESAIKFDLLIGDGGVAEVFTRKAVRFANEDSNGADFSPRTSVKVVGTINTTTIRVVRTNRDKNDDLSIFTTICGKLKDS